MGKIYDSLSTRHKLPTGCAKVNEDIYFRVNISRYENPSDVQLIFSDCLTGGNFSLEMKFAGMYEEEVIFEAKFNEKEVKILRYHFEYNSNGRRKYIKRKQESFIGEVREENNGGDWQLTIYTPIITHPNMQNGIMYQIFPDRFFRASEGQIMPEGRLYREWGKNEDIAFRVNEISKDFFGGNLRGISQKLEFLKSLGVTVLYLNPIWWAETNHRYDANAYQKVDPLLGTEEDLKEFVNKAHSLNIIVILDAVLNHTGWQNIYFKQACESRESPYYEWYHFINHPYEYECWWGDRSLPKVNQESISFQKHMYEEGGVLDYWFSLGIDGLRLDVVDEFSDDTVKKINIAAKRTGKPVVIIGEVWEDASCKESYGNLRKYLLGEELTSVMNYPVKNAILAYIRYGDEKRWISNLWYTLNLIFIENYPKEIANSLMNLLSTHDTVRAITKLAGPEVDGNDVYWQKDNDVLTQEEYFLGRERLRISYLLLYFLPGVPSIFYGDEAGLSGQKDPFCRKCYPWDNEDKELLEFFKTLGKFRSENSDFFAQAKLKVVTVDAEKCIIERMTDKRKLRLIINRTDRKISISASISLSEKTKVLLETKLSENKKELNPYSGIVIEIF